MGRALSNNTALAFAVESALATLPGSPVWKRIQPNTITKFGADTSKVARDPMTNTRQRQKGTIVDLDSGVEIEHDLTMELMSDFLPYFMYTVFKGPANSPFTATAVTATGYTVAAGGALAQSTLIYASGFLTAANNGLKVVGAASTGTEIKTSGLSVEAGILGAQNARVEIAGVQGASGDIQIDASGNITSTVLDFTTLGLTVGCWGYNGGTATVNQFATAADRGWFRVRAIAAHLLTIDRRSQTWTTDNGSGKTIHLYFGRFLRDVATDHADYSELSVQWEALYKNLGVTPGTDEYQYAKGNYANELTFNLPLTSKSTVKMAWIGTDTPVPTTVRATNANAPVRPVDVVAVNTTADIARLRVINVDETGITTDFKSMTLSIKNNVNPEKVLAVLGARFMNLGNLEVDIDTAVLFTLSDVLAAIRTNRTCSMDIALRNDDGGLVLDCPAVTLDSGELDFVRNETIKVNIKEAAFPDPILGYVLGITLLPYVPAS